MAADREYLMAGSIEALAPDPANPLYNNYFHSFSNPEINFDKACRRGNNGADPRLRVGYQFPIVDGNGKRLGRGKVVDAYWEDDIGLRGNCIYEYKTNKMPRANYYCPVILGSARLAANRKYAVNKRLTFHTEYAGAFPPQVPPGSGKGGTPNWGYSTCYISN